MTITLRTIILRKKNIRLLTCEIRILINYNEDKVQKFISRTRFDTQNSELMYICIYNNCYFLINRVATSLNSKSINAVLITFDQTKIILTLILISRDNIHKLSYVKN